MVGARESHQRQGADHEQEYACSQQDCKEIISFLDGDKNFSANIGTRFKLEWTTQFINIMLWVTDIVTVGNI